MQLCGWAWTSSEAKIEMLSRSIDGVDETVSLSKEYLLTIPKPDVESDPLSDTSGSGKKA